MSDDPYAVAMTTEENTSRVYHGQITVDSWFCVLEKGIGRRQFDANTDKVADRKTCIQMFLQPVSIARFTDVVQRDMVAEFGKDWLKITRPSLAAVGHDLRSIHNQWVEVELVPYGTYTNKAGEEKNLTAFRFTRVFANEAEANYAYSEYWKGNRPAANGENSGNGGNGGGDAQREVAAKFLPALWKSAGQDVTAFAEAIAKNPVTSKFFDLSSPEVLSLVGAEKVF